MIPQFYARIVREAERKRDYSYRVSFQQDVGSSFDPALEDPAEWEHDLRGTSSFSAVDVLTLTCLLAGTSSDSPRPPSEFDEDEADELAALAEDEAYWEALGNTDNLDDPALDIPPEAERMDEDMDMS